MLQLLGACHDAPEVKTQDLFRVYPNPCISHVNFQLLIGNAPVSVTLIGVNGNKIHDAILSSNSNNVEIDLTNEASGQLYFEVIYEGKLYREKLIKLE